jgi:hypothetical protein
MLEGIMVVAGELAPTTRRATPRIDPALAAGVDMAAVAALVGDPARANMLAAMLDGRAHTATELAHAEIIARE